MASKLRTKFGEITHSTFAPARLCSHRHIQTIWPKYFLNGPDIATQRERIQTPDGDFLDLNWLLPERPRAIVFVLHGLEGSVASHYVKHLFSDLYSNGIGAVLMHFRGCSGEINLRPKAYHSGEIDDPYFALKHVQARYPDVPTFAVGYSLGGNALLKMVSQYQPELLGCVAVSSPIDLKSSSVAINKGFSKAYQRHLLTSMKQKIITKMQIVDMREYISVNAEQIKKFASFYDFDEHLTAPIHGYQGADDYYQRASAKPDLHLIDINTLILHAADDPFMDEQVIPDKNELSSTVAYELAEKGGHVGFMQRKSGKLCSFVPERITSFIEELL